MHIYPITKGIRPETNREEVKIMTNVINMLREAATNYARYVKTRDEIANISRAVSLDLDIYPADAERMAREAVYGKAA